jgi:hypothetical protein
MPELTDADFENLAPGNRRTLIHPGCYPARFRDRRLDYRRKDWGEKLVCDWEVYPDPSTKQFVVLSRYYNITRDGGGRFIFGHGHDYRNDWIMANRGKHPLEKYRLPVTIFKNGLFWVEVVTVTTNAKGKIHPSLHWSKIGRIVWPVSEGQVFKTLPLHPTDTTDEFL